MKTFKLKTSAGILFLHINSRNTLNFNDGPGTENGSKLEDGEVGGIIYRGNIHSVSGQGGIQEDNTFEVQTWQDGNTMRFVRPDDSDYYKTNGLYFNYNGGVGYKGQVKVYEIIKAEINKFIKENKKEVRAAFLERDKNDRQTKIHSLLVKRKNLIKEADVVYAEAMGLIQNYRLTFNELIPDEVVDVTKE